MINSEDSEKTSEIFKIISEKSQKKLRRLWKILGRFSRNVGVLVRK
ncbi:hypothetical protein HMPREF9999_01328 [Alloprevotella sp. oral taxon 473 str. F0040]|nr:hypothetical protein HMPREF9999_01328 [Alloprevotella sp. oral taxon 473 str. F0040]